MEIVFYTKAGCHLCDDAREMLEELAADTDYRLTEIDIRSDMTLFAEYRYRIPVIILNQVNSLEGRIDPQELARAVQQTLKE
jgi:glutaredoxin